MSPCCGNAGEVATLAGVDAEVRGVESIGAAETAAHVAKQAASALGVVASVTGSVDHVSDGERVVAVENGHPLLASITGTGCMSSAITGAFLAVRREDPLEAAAEALAAFGVAGENAAPWREGRARSMSTSTTLSLRSTQSCSTSGRGSREGARARRGSRRRRPRSRGRCNGRPAARKGATTAELVQPRRGLASLGATFVVNDDVDAAVALAADGVHLGQGDRGAEQARAASLLLGRSVATVEQALAADGDYLGAGPVWATPSKLDGDPRSA